MSSFLPQLTRRKIKDYPGIRDQQQQIEPQQLNADAFQENSARNLHEITRRDKERNHLDHAGHAAERVDESRQ